MKISTQWLGEWVEHPGDAEALSAQLTMAGLEVDGIEPAAPAFDQVVVGRVQTLEPHPNAERLRVATVDVGGERPLQIVCGAPNVAEGMLAPTALVGATLPGGLAIQAAPLREVLSEGMLCSAAELGLAEQSEGLMPLPETLTPGEDIRRALTLDDAIIDIDLTPNRGDCLSVAGIAREVAVLLRRPFTPPAVEPVAPTLDDRFPVRLEAPADCPRFAGRVIRHVDVNAPTPLWMVERLRRAGIRSLGPVVDVTNYVMLELGQPMHAYDLATLQGAIVVRRATGTETVTLLNDQTVTPQPDTLVIADEARALALAGIMGGASSAVGDNTRDLFLEVAFFSPTAIAGRARRFGLHTDASHRFERGVDPDLQPRALERATGLILALCGGEPGPGTLTEDRRQVPSRPAVTLGRQRLLTVLGTAVADREVEDILGRLAMTVAAGSEGWQVTPPSHRFDIAIEEDLIEEIARVHGYGQIPAKKPLTRVAMVARPEDHLELTTLQGALRQRGYQEIITYSFVAPDLQRHLDPEAPSIALANPISADMAVMRTSLWPGLIKTLEHNQKRQQSRLRVFETGLVFRGGRADALDQRPRLGGLLAGAAEPEGWATRRRGVDFFDLKGDVEALLSLSRGAYQFSPARHPALHPGQSARIERDGVEVGWLGALHPGLLKPLDLEGGAFLFELDLAAISRGQLPHFEGLSKFPASHRDLAFVVDEATQASAVAACVQRHAGPLLRDVVLFDVYRGEELGKDRKSLAFSLILQDFSSNLTDAAVDQAVSNIVAGVRDELGGALRS